MKSELNNYGIQNPDGMIRDRFGEVRQTFSNDGARFVRETPIRDQREVNRTAENFDPGAARRQPAPAQPKVNAASDYQAIADQTLTATSSTASAASGAAAASTTATAAATGSATAGAAAGAATAAAATVATGATAAVGTIAATVATAVIVVAVFVSTLAINLSLLLAGMTSLVFRVEMTGAQDEDFETPIYATITDGDEYYDVQEVFRDTLLLTFEGLSPDTEYTVTVQNEEKIFFEKTYVTAKEEVDRGFLSAWNEGNEIFMIVEGVTLGDRERFTVSATDERGNVIFARDGVEEFAEYSFKLDKPRNLYFTLLVGGKIAAATEIRMLDDAGALYDFGDPVWSWSDDRQTAEVSFVNFFGGDPLILTATVTESVDAEPDCENDGFATYYAAAYFEDREFFDETTLILPAFGHFYTAEFDWIEGGDGDYLGATAILTCSHDPDHTLELEAELTREEFDATCDADAYVIFRATVDLDGETYDDTRTSIREGTMLGHLYPDLYSDEPADSAFTLTKNGIGEVTAAELTLTCLRCNESKNVPATEVERMTWNANVCEDTEAEFYLFWETEDIMEYAKYVTVPVTPAGHDYQPEWEWTMNVDGWYNEDGATLCFVCSHDHTHRFTAAAANVAEDRGRYTEATCTDPAESIYVATAEYEGKTYTDEKTVVWEYSTLGHNFGDLYENEPGDDQFNIQKNANGEITAASMTLRCLRCDQDVTLDAVEIEVSPLDGENLCEDGGMAQYYLFWNQDGLEYAKYVESEVGPIGHDYTNERFDWTEDDDGGYSGATLVFTCSHDGAHTVQIEATLTSQSYEATCEDNARVVWTATAEYEGRTYTDTQTITDYGSVLGHDYPDPMLDDEQTGLSIEYRQNERGEITGATMTLTCARCGHTETYEADEIELTENHQVNLCEDGGEAEYTVFWGSNGMEVRKYKTVTVDPLGHDYAAPVFNWTEDGDGGYTGATATFTCNRNGEHESTVSTELSHEYVAATCDDGAYTLYTATVIFGGVPYSDARTVVDPENPATGHDYPDPNEGGDVEGVSIVYRYDGSGAIVGATMTLTCANCGETVSYEADEIEPQTPEPDLCSGETVEYYVFWSDLEHEEYKEVTLSPLGHDYSSYEFEWYEDGDGYAANLILTCSRNPDHVETVAATVTKSVTETPGASNVQQVTYHAVAEYGGETYEDDYFV